MKNDLFSIGPFTIHGYGLMMAIGILSAYYMVEYRAKKKGMDYEKVFPLALWAVAGGLLGAKLLYLITRMPEIFTDTELLLHSLKNGFVVYGSIIGGVLTAYVFCKVKKMDFWRMFDLVAPALAFAQGIGRIGCFLAGCCYGMQVSPDCPIAITFKESAYAPNNVPLLPTQLISSGLNFLHFAVLMLLSKKCKHRGQVAGFYLVFYSIGRFILEYFRGDLIRGSVGTLTTSQFISVFILLAGLLIIFALPRFDKNQETSASSAQ